jgi:hypothetical protein
MTLLRELWSGDEATEEVKTTYEYVFDMRNRLEDTCKLAEQELLRAREKQKQHFDKKTVPISLQVGDHALLLLPTDSNKLLMQWKGPFKVLAKVGQNDYAIEVNDRRKIFHINMLKKYNIRHLEPPTPVSVAAVIFGDVNDDNISGNETLVNEQLSSIEETYLDVNINPDLSDDKKIQLKRLIYKYRNVFSSIPGTTHLAEHQINLTDSEPIRSKPYPLPYAKLETVKREIDSMLNIDVIEPSDSPYCSPIVLVKKSDGSDRFCADMRKVNQVTQFDCEPTPDPEMIFANLAGANFYSKLDCCKGYWQIPMSEDSKVMTAFSTPFGHYQFKKMPFGLVNAGATYARMMRKLLRGIPDVDNFVDDILTHSLEWNSHLVTLEALFHRVRDANLTMKPSKCFIGYQHMDFLGSHIKDGLRLAQDGKILKIRDAKVPVTKKQLQSFLGLSNYLRRFIANYAELVKPLTDLTR